jgi:nucleotide-binding universal stress UspA family protein
VYSRILVGTDGSATAAKAVDRAVAVASATGASLTVLSAGKGEVGLEIAKQDADRHRDSGVEIDARSSSKDPVSALIETAEEGGYDLIVVGNKGMTGARRFLPIGAVPNKVIHHLPTAVLIVRTT